MNIKVNIKKYSVLLVLTLLIPLFPSFSFSAKNKPTKKLPTNSKKLPVEIQADIRLPGRYSDFTMPEELVQKFKRGFHLSAKKENDSITISVDVDDRKMEEFFFATYKQKPDYLHARSTARAEYAYFLQYWFLLSAFLVDENGNTLVDNPFNLAVVNSPLYLYGNNPFAPCDICDVNNGKPFIMRFDEAKKKGLLPHLKDNTLKLATQFTFLKRTPETTSYIYIRKEKIFQYILKDEVFRISPNKMLFDYTRGLILYVSDWISDSSKILPYMAYIYSDEIRLRERKQLEKKAPLTWGIEPIEKDPCDNAMVYIPPRENLQWAAARVIMNAMMMKNQRTK